MAALVMASSQSAPAPFESTIKCATCSRPLQLDELETHVCAKSSSPPPKTTPTPPRTPSPLGRTSNDFRARGPSPTTQRARSPLGAATPVTAPEQRTQSPSPSVQALRTPPPPLRRSATDSSNSNNVFHEPGASTSTSQTRLHPRATEEIHSPSSPRRSMTAPSRHRADSSAPARPFVESIISQSDASSQYDAFGASYGRESGIPQLSLHIPDTESGGSAGRAGVGRRAFAAVAQAALLASSYGHHEHPPQSPMSPFHPHHLSYTGSVQYLDVNGRGLYSSFLNTSSTGPLLTHNQTLTWTL